MTKIKFLIAIAGCAMALLSGCESNDMIMDGDGMFQTFSYTNITQDEAKHMMEQDDGHVIVDVRRQDEYDEGHIPGAILIPNETIENDPPVELPDYEQIILIYCRSGRRSKEASQKLADMGYKNVYEFGGIIDWTGEVVKSEITDKTRDKATEEITEEAADKATEEAADKITEDTTDKAMEEAADKITEDTTDKTNEETTDKTTEETKDKATEETTEPTEKKNELISKEVTLRFDSFDGGGPEYNVIIKDESIVSYTAVREYAKADHDMMTGAGYDMVYTFTGLKPGKTDMLIEARSPIADNFDINYRITVSEDLSVKIEEVSATKA